MKQYFLLFLLSLFSTHLIAQESLTCKDFKEGTFVIKDPEGIVPDTYVIRKGNQQTEIIELNGERLEAVIDLAWIDDCTYTVVFNLENGAPQGIESEERNEKSDHCQNDIYRG